jgi:hypothetical protein
MVRLRALVHLSLAVAAVALSACGGGRSGTAPPSGLSYSGTTSLVVGTAATLTPTVTGTVTGWAVNPALPAGLSLDTTTGVISGTPTVASALATYTITASNAGGSAEADEQIAVAIAAPSALSYTYYSVNSATLVVGTAVSISPTVSGTVTSWTVSPALPAGLSLDAATGEIAGTPTANSPTAPYTITASNSSGSVEDVVQITVNEVSESVTQSAQTGLVYVVIDATSTFGVAQVGGTFNGQPLTPLTAPNYCPPGSTCPPGTGDYAYLFNANALGSGGHTLVVQVTTSTGVVNTFTSLIVFDNPPVLNVTPDDGAIVYGTLNVSGTATHDKYGAITTTIQFNGATLLQTTNQAFSTSYSLAGLAPGNYTMTVTSTDVNSSSGVSNTITVASAANLVFTPVTNLGIYQSLLAVDTTSFLSTDYQNFLLHTGTTLSTLSYQPNAITGSNGDWAIYNGNVFADGGASTPPSTTATSLNVYEWTPANVITDLSTLTNLQNATQGETLVGVHDGWALFAVQTTTTVGQPATTTYVFYNLISAQVLQIPVPSGATSADGDGSFYLAQGQLVLYYSAQTGATSSDIYSWSQATGVSTRVTSGGSLQRSPQTDGVRVAWVSTPPNSNCANLGGCTLSVLSIAGGTVQSVSQAMATFALSDGLLAWTEISTTGGGLKVSDGTTTTVLSSQTTAQLFGVGTGYVLYENDGFMYDWSSAAGALPLFNAMPRQAFITGKTVYFTSGSINNAVYQITLP